MRPLLPGCMVLILAAPALAWAQPAEAPPARRPNVIPQTYTNLKVLPADISRTDLMNVMRSMSVGLSLRCAVCHAVSDDLTSGDFASDEKPSKAGARTMLKAILDVRK